jgi:hypothetical protein
MRPRVHQRGSGNAAMKKARGTFARASYAVLMNTEFVEDSVTRSQAFSRARAHKMRSPCKQQEKNRERNRWLQRSARSMRKNGTGTRFPRAWNNQLPRRSIECCFSQARMIDCRCPQPIYQRPHTRRLLQCISAELTRSGQLTVTRARSFAPRTGSPKAKKSDGDHRGRGAASVYPIRPDTLAW